MITASEQRVCKIHGITEFITEKFKSGDRIKMRCKKCRVASTIKCRKKNKDALIKEFGGKCHICGYNRCTSALHFHHLNPEEKEGHVTQMGRSLERMRLEAKKCILLCANCHIEVHAGKTILGVIE